MQLFTAYGLVLALLTMPLIADDANLMYFCTASDSKFYPHTLNLIGSIHKHDFEKIGEIAVFDLGLSSTQKAQLALIQKVRLFSIEQVHPDLLKQFNTRTSGKPVPGWYAWKPVAIKQALELYPLVLWIDAGTTILRSLEPLFAHITQHGYFFHNGSDCPIAAQLTKTARTLLGLEQEEYRWILNPQTRGVEAGLMGFSKAVTNTFVQELYKLAHSIEVFADDGSAPDGFGGARHDTSVYSVMVNKYGYRIHQHGTSPAQTISLRIHEKDIEYYITYEKSCITNQTSIYISRHDVQLAQYGPYIHYK